MANTTLHCQSRFSVGKCSVGFSVGKHRLSSYVNGPRGLQAWQSLMSTGVQASIVALYTLTAAIEFVLAMQEFLHARNLSGLRSFHRSFVAVVMLKLDIAFQAFLRTPPGSAVTSFGSLSMHCPNTPPVRNHSSVTQSLNCPCPGQ
jgi:hypothetical protein